MKKPKFTRIFQDKELSRDIAYAKADALIDRDLQPGELIKAITPVFVETCGVKAKSVAKQWIELRPPMYTFHLKDEVLEAIRTAVKL